MKILAYIEQRNGELKKNAFEVITAAKNLADRTSGTFVALLVGSNVSSLAPKLGDYGARDVIVIDDTRLSHYAPMATATAITETAKNEGANVVLLSNTSYGKDLAPVVSVRLGAGLASDVIAIEANDGNELSAVRPVYAGKARVSVQINTEIKVLSLRPNVFTATQNPSQANVRSGNVEFGANDFATKVVETRVNTGKPDVAEADIVVSGGRGLKEASNFNLIENLAQTLSAAVGASRAVVDAGWRPHSEQVGQTGKTVSPSLYVACGISGAVQHLAGMSSSKYIVAINKDKDAPIFSVADYGIIGDVFDVLPMLNQEIKNLHGK